MGLESYLFNIEFETSIHKDTIVEALEQAGLAHLSEKMEAHSSTKFGSWFFELRTLQGLTEAHCFLRPEKSSISYLNLRFSILSPRTVIEQSFKVIEKLNEIHPLILIDEEIGHHIYRKLRKDGMLDETFKGLNLTVEEQIRKLSIIPRDVKSFSENILNIRARQIILENYEGSIVEGGSATFKEIEDKGSFDRYIEWIKKEM